MRSERAAKPFLRFCAFGLRRMENGPQKPREGYKSDQHDVVNDAFSKIQRCLYERKARHPITGQNHLTLLLLLRFTLVAGNEHEFLDAFGVVDLTGVQVSVRIRGDLVHPVELSGIATAMASFAQNISVVAFEYPQNVVLAVSQNHELLLSVA